MASLALLIVVLCARLKLIDHPRVQPQGDLIGRNMLDTQIGLNFAVQPIRKCWPPAEAFPFLAHIVITNRMGRPTG